MASSSAATLAFVLLIAVALMSGRGRAQESSDDSTPSTVEDIEIGTEETPGPPAPPPPPPIDDDDESDDDDVDDEQELQPDSSEEGEDTGDDSEATTTVKPEKKVCQYSLSGPHGRFATENFPDGYASNTNCTWNITVEEDQKVQVTFHLFNVEFNSRCSWDWVKVFDSNYTVLKHFCGYIEQDLVVTSTNNTLSLQFFTDGVVETAGFLASWQAVPKSQESKSEESAATPSGMGYMLSFPQSFTSSEESMSENVCLQLYNVTEDGEVKVSLFSADNIVNGSATVMESFNHKSGDESISCLQMKLPDDFEHRSGVIEVKAEFPESEYRILSYKSVRTLQIEPMVLVQTDKSDYRPNQKVFIRVLLLNYQLRPSVMEAVPEIWIVNPRTSRIAQWKNVTLDRGIAQVEMQLPEEPILGKWNVHVNHGGKGDEIVSFTVSENVLPKFEVTVEAPKVILKDAEVAPFKICARYTHGGQVKGALNATFYSDYRAGNYWRAPMIRVNVTKLVDSLENGCTRVILNTTQLAALTRKTNNLKLLATVTEGVTDIKQNTSWTGDVKLTPLVISFEGSSKNHIVGNFPYVGKIKVARHDGTPQDEVNLEVCTRLFTSLVEMRNNVNRISHRMYSFTEDDFLALAERIQTLRHAEVCSPYKTDSDGLVKFAVPLVSIPANVTKLSLKITAVDHPSNRETGMQQPTERLDVDLTQSNATSALTIFSEEEPHLTCGANSVRLFLSAKPNTKLDLNYFISSGGAILGSGSSVIDVGSEDLEAEYVAEATTINVGESQEAPERILTSHDIEIKRPLMEEGKVTDNIKLLVYIRDTDGHTLSATNVFNIESCDSTPAIGFSDSELNPGDRVQFTIAGESEALCGYSIVDKSVELQGNANRVTRPRVQKLKESIATMRIVRDTNRRDGCKKANLLFRAFERLGLFILSDQIVVDRDCESLVDVTAKVRTSHLEPVAFNSVAMDDFDNDGIVNDDEFFAQEEAPVLAQASFAESAQQGAPRPQAFANRVGGGAGGNSNRGSVTQEKVAVQENKVELRNFFPETWLFDLVDLDVNGNALVEVNAPHTVTTWIAEVVCSHPTAGLGISNKSSLLVTQDFFVDLNMPYSVKRGEILPVNVSIFNRVDRNLPMKIVIQDSQAFKLDDSTAEVCLSGNDNDIKTFRLKAKELNEVNVTVEAKITDEIEASCDSADEAEGFTDMIERPLQVKPEGFPVEKMQSIFHCQKAGEEAEPVLLDALVLPEDLVEDSARAWVTVSGDVMAPALENLDNLVTLPVGCGEQNMIKMAPNVYVMDYLNGTGKSEPELETKAKEFMMTGYEREQEFRHKDGAYSIWGPQDKDGSIWLTSFVVKVFSQASRFIEIPNHNLQESVDWIVHNQFRNGCFPNRGYAYHHDIKSADQSLTAHTLITLLEVKQNNAEIKLDSEILSRAVGCIVGNTTTKTDIYTKSIATYALSLFNQVRPALGKDVEDVPEAVELLTDVLLAGDDTSVSGKLFWKPEKPSRSREVEITAYNVLSLVSQDRLPEALKAIRWLATRRNSRGGFVSTQDTMVALQALSQYSLKVSTDESDLKIAVKEAGVEEQYKFDVNEDNLLLLQRQRLQALPNELAVEIVGGGCLMVQTWMRFNVKESPEKEAFSLEASQKGSELKVCAAYTGDKKSTGMVVIEIELLSGFTAYRESLEALKNEVEAPVRKYEYDEEKQEVVLYFDKMPKEETCWSIEVKEQVEIENRKPAIVKIYDYYNQDDIFSSEYLVSSDK